MPANRIAHYSSQADWQSGTADGLDLTTSPGDILLSSDYVYEADTKAEWNAGTHAGTKVTGDVLQLADNGIDLTAGVVENQTQFQMRQRITARGLLEWVGWHCYTSSGILPVPFEIRKVSDNSLLWSCTVNATTTPQYIGADPRIEGTPQGPLVLTEDVYIILNYDPGGLYRGVTGTADAVFGGFAQYLYGSWTSWTNRYGSIRLIVRGDYTDSGTWTSPWLNHGKGASPASTWLSWLASLPEGSGLTTHIRWSPDNGATYSEWEEVQSGEPMPGPTKAYCQVRFTLTPTEDLQETPTVSHLMAIIGELHRWTSPAISLADTGDPKLLVLPPTALHVIPEVNIGGAGWESFAGLINTGEAESMQFRLTLLRTGSDTQYLSEASLYEAIILQMQGEPTPRIRPPEVTDVICYVEDSIPLVEVTASTPGIPADKRVEVRVSVPAGSSQEYAEAYAAAYLANHGAEKRTLTCEVPLCTRVSFGELLAVVYPPWGYALNNPWLAMVQEITHRPLANPPHTEIVIGDYEPDDIEALVRLLPKEG